MDDAKPSTLTIAEADLTADLRSGAQKLTPQLESALAKGQTIALLQRDGTLIYISHPAALSAQLDRLRAPT